MASAIVSFLAGVGLDGAGRSVADVLAFNDLDVERRHDFIQWLFPLPEPSQAVPGSPVLTPADILQLRRSSKAQINLRAAAERMGHFYEASDQWLAPHDHNHLRITRIIRSLRLLSGDAMAEAFRGRILARVSGASRRVSRKSLEHWMAA